jgi:acid phosphatase family membrane protein YuiD
MKSYIYLLAPLIAWMVAQTLKVAIDLRKDGVDWADAIASGGMPSAHTAGIVSLLTVLGSEQGLKSPIFALCFTITGIVVYDAVGVRRTAGEIAVALKELQSKSPIRPQQHLHISRGHTPAQVLVGGLVGATIGLILINSL